MHAYILVGRELTFAGLDALLPSVIKVAGLSTLLEPTASASATSEFAGVVDGALGTINRGRRRGRLRRVPTGECF